MVYTEKYEVKQNIRVMKKPYTTMLLIPIFGVFYKGRVGTPHITHNTLISLMY